MFKIRCPASIWRQNDQKCWVTSQNIQNNAKLQNRSNYNELHPLDVKTIKTNLNYKSDQNPMTCKSKRLKCWVTSQNIQNNAKLQNRSNYNELHRLDVRTIKTKLNYKSDLNYKSYQNPMTGIDLTSKISKMVSYVAKHSKQRKTKKTDQITMNCIDWMSKRSKQS